MTLSFFLRFLALIILTLTKSIKIKLWLQHFFILSHRTKLSKIGYSNTWLINISDFFNSMFFIISLVFSQVVSIKSLEK